MQNVIFTHEETNQNINFVLECLCDLGKIAEGSEEVESLIYYEREPELLKKIDMAYSELEELLRQLTEKERNISITKKDVELLQGVQASMLESFEEANYLIHDDNLKDERLEYVQEAANYLDIYLTLEKIIKIFEKN
jgi:hypothetical protein